MAIELQQALIIVGIEIVIGLVIGFIAGLIWKENRPIGVRGDYAVSIGSSVIFGVVTWFLLPALGFGQTLRLLGVFGDVPFLSLAILWLIRYLNKNK